MKTICLRLFSLLLAALLLPGCSMLTKSGRQQAAYARYVHKMSGGRVKQQKMFRSNKPSMPVTAPNEPLVVAEASGPEAVPRDSQ